MTEDFKEFIQNLDATYANSAAYMSKFNFMMHHDARLAEAHEAAKAAHEASVWGHDARKDSKGRFIQQGIGSPGRENRNHFDAILKYRGPAEYAKAVKEIFGRDPKRAEALGLEMPRA
jgi:hypothetical protein